MIDLVKRLNHLSPLSLSLTHTVTLSILMSQSESEIFMLVDPGPQGSAVIGRNYPYATSSQDMTNWSKWVRSGDCTSFCLALVLKIILNIFSYFGWDSFCGRGLWGSLLCFVNFFFLFIFLLKIDAVVDLSCHKPIAHEASMFH